MSCARGFEAVQESAGTSDRRNPKRKSSTKSTLFLLLALLIIIAGLLVVVVAYLPRVNPAPPVRLPDIESADLGQPAPQALQPERSPSEPAQAKPSTPIANPPVATQPAAYRRAVPQGKLIFIIDDVGNDLKELRPFLRFPGPLTLSIMPQRPYTLEAYRLIVSAGKIPMLHQPMEADGGQNPGAGAILTSMSKGEVDSLLTRNLDGMDAVHWVNNHMGSKATSDFVTMTNVLGYLKTHGLHFLDSRTTRATVVEAAALRLGLPYYRRNSYFLDDTVKKSDILAEIARGLQVARKDGYAVMIGHVWDSDLAAILIRLYPQLVAEGYQFADINALIGEVSAGAGSGN